MQNFIPNLRGVDQTIHLPFLNRDLTVNMETRFYYSYIPMHSSLFNTDLKKYTDMIFNSGVYYINVPEFSDLAYVKLGTSGCWVRTRTGAGVTAALL